ncbi:MAG: hypothetical protein A2X30_02490 [Elusimicrobia bacterium GWB2_63_16]|nr:MAG: hypothetical protein A2X30_02490 [Elusimicrobia bacterium GWB2_63_16]
MLNKALVPFVLSVLFFSAPRGAAAFDFDKPSVPLTLAAAPLPPAPAPARAPRLCKPFLLAVSVGGVAETVVLERACTPENEPVWVMKVEAYALAVRVVSDRHPAERQLIEKRIKSMVVDGISQEDADFIVLRTGPALQRAAAAAPEERQRLLQEAAAELLARLARP